jgi:hypothetical protein
MTLTKCPGYKTAWRIDILAEFGVCYRIRASILFFFFILSLFLV